MKSSFLKYAAITLIIAILTSTYTCKKDSTSSGSGDDTKPEINVKVDGKNIANGSGSHDFGDINLGASSTIYTFIIQNLGDAVLNLTHTPPVSVTGVNANDIVVIQQPNSSVAEGDETEFKMQFTPSSEGAINASVLISNNDSNNSKFTFTTRGNGIAQAYSATEVAQKIVSLLNIPTTSEVTLIGPVEPGTKVVEQNLGDVTPQELQLPISEGSYFVFLIDNEPDALFGHDMDYGWIEMEGETVAGNADVFWPGLIERPNATPEPFTVLETIDVNGIQFTYASGDGLPEGEDNSHKNEPGTISKMFYNPYIIERDPVKVALVIDAGETSGSDRLYDLHTRPMSDWVSGEGFHTIHTSQDASNTQTRFPSPAAVITYLNYLGQYFTDLGEPECGCDEFFLYITGHGAESGNSGIGLVNGNVDQLLKYIDIYQAIYDSFPSYVKVTLFYDSCFSGRAISDLPNPINTLCGELCALTVLTSCKETVSTKAPVYGALGAPVYVSGTQMFGAGANLDHDGDGDKGDIKDRFTEMQGRQTTLGSKSTHCPEGGSWCSLDSPPAPYEIANCTGVTHYNTSSAITVCIKYCYAEGMTVDMALYGPSPGTASVVVVNGEACYTFPINWYGDYTWTATLNPGGLPSTGYISIVDDTNVPCEY